MVANVGVAVGIGSQAQPVQFVFPFPVLVDAILIFDSQSTSGNVGRRRAYPSRTLPKKMRHLSPVKVIFLPELMVAILNYGSRTTSGNVRNDI